MPKHPSKSFLFDSIDEFVFCFIILMNCLLRLYEGANLHATFQALDSGHDPNCMKLLSIKLVDKLYEKARIAVRGREETISYPDSTEYYKLSSVQSHRYSRVYYWCCRI